METQTVGSRSLGDCHLIRRQSRIPHFDLGDTPTETNLLAAPTWWLETNSQYIVLYGEWSLQDFGVTQLTINVETVGFAVVGGCQRCSLHHLIMCHAFAHALDLTTIPATKLQIAVLVNICWGPKPVIGTSTVLAKVQNPLPLICCWHDFWHCHNCTNCVRARSHGLESLEISLQALATVFNYLCWDAAGLTLSWKRACQLVSVLATSAISLSGASRTVVFRAFPARSRLAPLSNDIPFLASLASFTLRRCAPQAILDCLLGPCFMLLVRVSYELISVTLRSHQAESSLATSAISLRGASRTVVSRAFPARSRLGSTVQRHTLPRKSCKLCPLRSGNV